MRNLIVVFGILMLSLLTSCNDDKYEDIIETEKPALPTLKVYNMGGADEGLIMELTERLKAVYDNTVFAGDMPLIESAHIDSCSYGDNRYWAKGLFDTIKWRVDPEKEIALVIVNADICKWNGDKNGQDVLGLSLQNKNVSIISYNKLKEKNLGDLNNVLKTVYHELGHSVGNLVAGNDPLHFHCADKKCLMRDAGCRYPYKKVRKYCLVCESVMKIRGFKTENMNIK